jgi:hypothetical protein
MNCFTFTVLELTDLFLAFILANEYLRAQGLPGLADGGTVSKVHGGIRELAKHFIGVASGKLDADAMAAVRDTDKSP